MFQKITTQTKHERFIRCSRQNSNRHNGMSLAAVSSAVYVTHDPVRENGQIRVTKKRSLTSRFNYLFSSSFKTSLPYLLLSPFLFRFGRLIRDSYLPVWCVPKGFSSEFRVPVYTCVRSSFLPPSSQLIIESCSFVSFTPAFENKLTRQITKTFRLVEEK